VDWYYVSGNQQCGPITEAQLNELLSSGAIGPDTLVWRAGMAEWQPIEAVRPSVPAASPGASAAPGTQGTHLCAECGKTFPESDMVRLYQAWVCGACKPVFLQRWAEGAPPAAVGSVWRSARQIVMRKEAPLPDACVRCNAPANGFRLKRKLYWHSPCFYLLILVSLLIYVIVAICVRKKATIHIGLCERHRKRRLWFIAGSWLALLCGIAMIIGGASANASGGLILTGVILAVVSALVGIIKGAVVSAAKIDQEFVWVKGATPAFLASLPEWTAPR
jgi:hypothetical protein